MIWKKLCNHMAFLTYGILLLITCSEKGYTDSTSLQASYFSPTEYNALFDIYSQTSGYRWTWDSKSGVPWHFPSSCYTSGGCVADTNPCFERWQGLACNLYNTSLIGLYLDRLNLTDSLPDVFNQFPAATVISINFNSYLVGPLPESVCDLSLTNMFFSSTSLSGTIPSCYGRNWENMIELLISYNPFVVGSIPSAFCGMKSIMAFQLDSNRLTGSIPPCIFDNPVLSTLILSYNKLNGTLGPYFCNAKSLSSLELMDNSFSGSIPDCIGEMSAVTELFLSTNQFTGSLPSGICQLSRIDSIFLNLNRFTGTLPTCLNECTSL